MAGPDDSNERTEQATPRRLQKAREKGQIPRSRELNTMGVLLVGAAAMFTVGPALLQRLADIMRMGFSLSPEQGGDVRFIPLMLEHALTGALEALAPFLFMLAAVALVVPLALGGWSFSSQAIAFKWEKLDPIKGMKRVFGLRGLMELAKALVKFLVVLGVTMALLWNQIDAFMGLGSQAPSAALANAAGLIARSFLVLCSALILIALVDVPFQLWDHARQLRMSRQEVKDEYKETEGKPEVKSRQRNMQREVAQRRMMDEVPKADVIVTNPTHYAVALRYDPERMAAPQVVAKGADLLAARIRHLGQVHGVPLVTLPLLTRAIYYSTRIDNEIPAGLYLAVAQVLAYVFQLRSYRKEGGIEPAPPAADALEIPEELRR